MCRKYGRICSPFLKSFLTPVILIMALKAILEDPIAYFDVDDTLILDGLGKEGAIRIEHNDHVAYYLPHIPHVKEVVRLKKEGWNIVVWTHNSGGASWGEAVCKALGIDDYVDLYIWKPNRYYDDIPIGELLDEAPFGRYYLDPNGESSKDRTPG